MTSIQTIVVEPGTPELAICARWRATVLQASFEEELRSLELFASDQTQGVALVAKVDGEPIGTCLLVGSEISGALHRTRRCVPLCPVGLFSLSATVITFELRASGVKRQARDLRQERQGPDGQHKPWDLT
jgi:hypothetical protein